MPFLVKSKISLLIVSFSKSENFIGDMEQNLYQVYQLIPFGNQR